MVTKLYLISSFLEHESVLFPTYFPTHNPKQSKFWRASLGCLVAILTMILCTNFRTSCVTAQQANPRKPTADASFIQACRQHSTWSYWATVYHEPWPHQYIPCQSINNAKPKSIPKNTKNTCPRRRYSLNNIAPFLEVVHYVHGTIDIAKPARIA